MPRFNCFFISLSLSLSLSLSIEVDISIIRLVEIIKTAPLSNEEIQVIIDALLNKNTESDWINVSVGICKHFQDHVISQ